MEVTLIKNRKVLYTELCKIHCLFKENLHLEKKRYLTLRVFASQQLN